MNIILEEEVRDIVVDSFCKFYKNAFFFWKINYNGFSLKIFELMTTFIKY